MSDALEYNYTYLSELMNGRKHFDASIFVRIKDKYNFDTKNEFSSEYEALFTENGNTSQNLNISRNNIGDTGKGLSQNGDMSRTENGITGVKFVPLIFQGEYFNNRLNHSYMKQLPIIVTTGLPYADPTHRVFEVGITYINGIKKGELLMCESVDISTFEQYEAHLIVTDKGIITAYLAKKNDNSVVWYGEDGKQHKIQISSIGEIWKPLHKYEPYISKKKVVEV